MAEKREFLVVIDGKESVSPAAGKASDSLGKLGDQAKDTEHDFDGLDRKMREHADTITHLRNEIAKTGDTKLFGELGRQEKAFGKLDGLKKSLSKAAGDAAPDMAVSLGGRLGPLLARLPVSGPMGIALVGAAVAAAAPVGAAIAAGITGGVGIGGVVGGFALVKDDPRVKAATSSLAAQVGGQLEAAAQPMAGAITHAVEDAGGELSKLQSDFRSIFRNSSVNVAPLVEGAVKGLSKIVDGFEKLNRSAGPTVREIGAGLSDLGSEIGRALESLSDNGTEAADAMRNLFLIINGGVRIVGGTINGLTELYGVMRKIQALRAGDTSYFARSAAAELAAQQAADGHADSLRDVGLGAIAAKVGLDAYVAAQRSAADGALTAREANLRLRESITLAADAADGKKKVTNEEERALLGLIRATNDATVATDGSGASAEDAAAKFKTNRDKVVAMAEKMGYSRSEAAKLADQLLKIPSVKPRVDLDQGPALRGVRNIQKAINGLHGKVIRNTIITGEFGGDDIGARHGMSTGGLVGGGGPPGKDTQVRVLASDEYVLTGKEVRQAGGPGGIKSALSGGGSVPMARPAAASAGRDTAITLVLDLPGMFRKHIRVNYGGNVQLALGG